MKPKLLGGLACIVAIGEGIIEENSNDNNPTLPRRNLQESIHTYIPRSAVGDAAAFDLDIYAIKNELGKQNDEGWANAMSIYHHGAFSKPIATVTLATPLQEEDDSIAPGTPVRGIAVDGSEIVGTTLGMTTSANETTLRIAYENDITKEGHAQCSVGGNPIPIIDGCLQAEGNITIGDNNNNNQTFYYTYNVSESNLNDHALVDLSTHAQSRMWTCSHCPFEHFAKFYNYYGEFDYADRIIQYAFRGQEMELDNGNMDFGYFTKYGMKEFITKAISYLSIWMYTIRQMEQAVADCEKGEFLQAVHFWDEAVAMYTGSRGMMNQDNNHRGDLMLHQADLGCQEFHTCGGDDNELGGNTDGRGGGVGQQQQSYVNRHVFEHFDQAQKNLLHNRCQQARQSKEEIVRLMTIPLIQATLRYAHIMAHETYFNEKHSAQASLFALSILPMIHDCSPKDATILYNQLKSNKNTEANTNVDYAKVRTALENTYECLHIQCFEIGGIWDETIGNYKSDAYPCGVVRSVGRGAAETTTTTSDFLSAVLGGTIGGLIFLGALGVWMWRERQKQPPPKEENNWLDGEDEEVDQEASSSQVVTFQDEPTVLENPETKKKKKRKTSQRLRDMLKQMG